MSTKKVDKYNYWKKLWGFLEKYKAIITVNANQVGSNQLQNVRAQLRKKNAVLLMGKNTLIKAGIRHAMKKPTQDDKD